MRAGTRPHWQGARASECAHVRGSIWLMLATETLEMKSFAGTQAVFERAARAMLACERAPAAVRAV